MAVSRRSHQAVARRRLAIELLEPRCLLHGGVDHDPGTDPGDEPDPAPVTEVEPNNSLATATQFSTISDTLVGSISDANDEDFFYATFSQGEILVVRPGTVPGQLHFAPGVEILDAQGNVKARSLDGSRLAYTVAEAGTYYVRLFSQNVFGTFTGSYSTSTLSITTARTTFSGTAESEPNNTLATADSLGSTTNFRGTLADAADVDYFSFSGTVGQAVAFKWGESPADNPTIRLYDPGNNLIYESLDGIGFHLVLPVSGTYRFAIGTDNLAGTVTGGYVGNVVRQAVVAVDAEAGNDFSSATLWNVGPTTTRVMGTLDSLSDADVFAVELEAGRFYSFTIDTVTDSLQRQGRTLSLYNEFGQLLEYTTIGTLHTNAATGFGFRVEKSGTHYIVVEANSPRGLGGYVLVGQRTSTTFPSQRDVPLYFHDYTGQTTHLGYGPADPLSQQAVVPLMVGMFEARYDIYDVNVTLVKPSAGTPYLGFGMGEFGSIGAYGYGGSFNMGSRQATGDSLVDDPGSSWNRLSAMRNAASVMNQETGHATGLYAHARHPLAYMAYDNQSALNVIGTYYPFPWTDSRVPDVEIRNQRDFLDWILQAGRIAYEIEGNDSLGSAQNLDGFLAEMTADADPRNDRVVMVGRIATAGDVDYYRFTAAADQTFAIDIDSAEFQNPLNAALWLFDGSGNLLAFSDDALDRESGLFSVDPYITWQFDTAGTYYIKVAGTLGTVGNYRLKLTGGQAFDTDGPRVIAAWPNGGSSVDGTRQLIFWFNDQIDPATLTPSTIIVQGASTGVHSGEFYFDPTDASLVWRAATQLPPDVYTVRLLSGPSGITDLKGNPLDGETDGTLNWPEISGDGVPGGDFVTTFTITSADNTTASVTSSSYRRHPYNRGLFTINFSDELDILSVYSATFTLRGTGADGTFNTADDTFLPVDVLYDKIKATANGPLEIYTRGVPDPGSYRLEAVFLDAAGRTVNLSRTFTVTAGTPINGPVVAELNVQPNTVLTTAPSTIEVVFSGKIDPSSLTADAFRLRYSPDPVFFDANDVYITEADGLISWDPTTYRAIFQPDSPLPIGYYLIELSGQPGGIRDLSGRLLDGEYLDSHVPGNNLLTHWNFAPSGDGLPGGDYRATFSIAANDPPTVQGVYVAGSSWSESFLDHLAAIGAGRSDLGLVMAAGSSQWDTLPWENLDRISIVFSEQVIVTAGDLILSGSPEGPVLPSLASGGFVYDAATFVATWLFEAPLPLNKYLISLSSAITDLLGAPLDGDWVDGVSAFGSGDGQPGGDFNFRINVLPGDIDNSQSVTFGELGQMRLAVGQSTASPGYNYRYDVDGSGSITFAEVARVRARTGSGLSAFSEPSAPPPSQTFTLADGSADDDWDGDAGPSPLAASTLVSLPSSRLLVADPAHVDRALARLGETAFGRPAARSQWSLDPDFPSALQARLTDNWAAQDLPTVDAAWQLPDGLSPWLARLLAERAEHGAPMRGGDAAADGDAPADLFAPWEAAPTGPRAANESA